MVGWKFTLILMGTAPLMFAIGGIIAYLMGLGLKKDFSAYA